MMPDPLAALAEAGAHLVICRPDKRPQASAWQKTPAPLDAALQHKGPVGVVPASLGCVVIDIDQGGAEASEAVIATLGRPLARVPTRREGGEHIWYRCRDAERVGNRTWAHGDIRGAKGYAILWKPELVAEGLASAGLVADLLESELDQLPRKVNGGAVGERNDTLNKGVYLATRNGAPIEPVVAAAREAGLPEREIEATVKSAKVAGERDGARVFIANARTPAGLAAALNAVGVGLRLNTRSKRYEYRVEGAWVNADDEVTAHLCRRAIPNACSAKKGDQVQALTYGRDMFLELRAALGHEARVDPFIAWLDELPPWDGVPRIDGLLTGMFGAADDALSKWASCYIGIGSIQRAYEPGATLDEVPVLIGEQGCGKSAFVREWFSEDQYEWHGDAMDLAAPHKQQAEALAGRVVIELSEMTGIRKAELERLKSFITRRDDGQHRGAYRRATEPSPRRCIFVGTSNELEALPNDPSGNRRFVVIELRHGCDVQAAARGRVQWWAEALARYHAGEPANLPRELMPEAAERAETHRGRDALEEEVTLAAVDLDSEFTLGDLHQQVFGHGSRPADKATQMRLSAALRNLGFSRTQRLRDGARQWVWRRG